MHNEVSFPLHAERGAAYLTAPNIAARHAFSTRLGAGAHAAEAGREHMAGGNFIAYHVDAVFMLLLCEHF